MFQISFPASGGLLAVFGTDSWVHHPAFSPCSCLCPDLPFSKNTSDTETETHLTPG